MSDIRIEIKNLEEIKSAFRLAPANMTRNLNTAIRKSIFKIEQTTKPVTPIDTGRLRSAFTTAFGNLQGSIFNPVEYAVFVHDGTRFMRARPFLQEGVEAAEPDIQGYFKDAVQETLNSIARGI